MNKNFHSFLLAQQEGTKAIIQKRISYYYTFEKYTQKYLPSFSINDAEKFDFYANKNSKYLIYKFSNHIKNEERERETIFG